MPLQLLVSRRQWPASRGTLQHQSAAAAASLRSIPVQGCQAWGLLGVGPTMASWQRSSRHGCVVALWRLPGRIGPQRPRCRCPLYLGRL